MEEQINKGKDFLEHYGVKGMRWGVRRKRPRGAASEDAQRHAANRKKNVSELSDRDLQQLVNRMNMEQQVGKLKKSSVKKGNNYVKELLAIGVTANAVIAFAASPAGQKLAKGIGRAAGKAFNIPVSSIGKTS